MRSLAANPRPAGAEKLSGHELYRIRQGTYRVLYEISDGDRTVTIIKIGHRRDVYR
jgi:mRNA interferase RelE/StbE